MNYIEMLDKQMEKDLEKIKKWIPNARKRSNEIVYKSNSLQKELIIVRYHTYGIANEFYYNSETVKNFEIFEELGLSLKELKIKEPPKKKIKRSPINWYPKKNEIVYYIDLFNQLQHVMLDRDCHFHEFQKDIFEYKEEAEKQIEINKKIFKINQRINKLNGDWEPDWTNEKECKTNLGYYPNKGIVSDPFNEYCAYYGKVLNVIKNTETYAKIINEFEKDLIEIFEWEMRINEME